LILISYISRKIYALCNCAIAAFRLAAAASTSDWAEALVRTLAGASAAWRFAQLAGVKPAALREAA